MITSPAAALFAGLAQAPPQNRAEALVVTLGSQTLTGWTDLRLSLGIDTYAALEIACPWDPSNEQHREVFRPFSFADIAVTVGGQEVFRGTALGIVPTMTPSERTISVSAYARCGKMADCTVPPAAWVASYEGLDFERIAGQLTRALGVALDFRAAVKYAPPEAKLEIDGKPWDLLTDIAKQCGCLLTSGAGGELVVWQAETSGLPVAVFTEGERPLMNISMSQNAQEYYSGITGLVPADSGKRRSKKRAGVPNKGDKTTIANPYWDPHGTAGDRPLTFKIEDAEAEDPDAATVAKMGRMLANAASWKIEVPTWRDQFGYLWKPNTLVTLTAPGVMVYRETTLLVSAVELSRTASEERATLTLVMPETYSGQIPAEGLPWE